MMRRMVLALEERSKGKANLLLSFSQKKKSINQALVFIIVLPLITPENFERSLIIIRGMSETE